MKKIYVCALAALTFAACTEDDFSTKPGIPVANSLEAVIEDVESFDLDDPDTRASYSTTSGAVTFSTNDAITVFNTTNGTQSFTYAGSSAKNFTGTIPEGTETTSSTFAFFPTDEIDASGTTVTLPTAYAANKFLAPMYGTIVGNTVSFTQLAGMLRLTVTTDQPTVTVTTQENLAGEATIVESGGSKVLSLTGTEKTVTLTMASSGKSTFYVPLVPGTYNLTISDGVNDKTFNEFTIERGQMATAAWLLSERTISMAASDFKATNISSGNYEVVNITEDVTMATNVSFGVVASGDETLNLGSNTITQTARGQYGSILVRGSKNLTINGNDDGGITQATATGSSTSGAVIWNAGSGTVTINGGTYQSNNYNAEVIYAEKGVINITGGVFKLNGSSADSPAKFLINCKDDNKGNIHITGGKYYDFDPANNTADGANTNYVESGYVSVKSVEVDEDNVVHNVYTVVPESEVTTTTTSAALLAATGAVTVAADTDLGDDYLHPTADTTYDLNGKTITTNEDYVAALYINSAIDVCVVGDGKVTSTYDNVDCVWMNNANATLTLAGGEWCSYKPDTSDWIECIYCQLGTIYITGGTYRTTGDPKFLLNCKDANYQAGKANIIVTGGKFYGFNPASNSAEGAGTNFCATGYGVTDEGDDANGHYYVIGKL